ncbi:MAG: hypothetical protein R2726_08855 [Acidimicrobiales bacterium]
MRVLVLEGRPGVADGAVEELGRAGHEVARCHEPDAPSFPCNAMLDGHGCPLDDGRVEVALVVRDGAGASAEAAEDGVRCALRRQVPLVVAGEPGGSALADWATVVTDAADALPDAVRQAAAAPLRRQSDAARRSLRSVLEHHGVDGSAADAEVVRSTTDLKVVLRPGVELDKGLADMASVRAVGAVRDVDPYARTINVSIEQPTVASTT